ncbi:MULTISPECIES: hypothetical protein [Calothrix]|uniref:Type I restriction modification DNA specificity domain-containing protein n=2 Tax=Calothrix TaxID=1186 RepID=A0ABR8AF71_9CYAN|nr:MULTISPECIES: hypothetical protein [Calothrix]MBD2198558.1 hypothetical protein [Calothrix parietina FACHB-288]MBD2226987.1 hypothetical protein [Calothrix anomala FACHB-343]
MHKNRVKARRLVTERLDPEYYHPQYLSDEDRLEEFGSEYLGKAGRFFVGPFGSKLPSSLYLDKGIIPLFRISNIGAMQVDFSGMAYLHPSVHAELKASEVLPGDLLIVKASVGEKICKIPENIPKANITQHIIALRPNGKFDIDFIAAFLFSGYGRRQLVRRSLGSIIQYLGVSDTKTVLLPKVDKQAETYIGDKVRLAERLRERSQKIETEVKQFFSIPYWNEEKVGMYRSYRTKSEIIHPERLDTAFYDPAHINLKEVLYRNRAIPLSKLANQVKKTWNKSSHIFYYLEIGEINLSNGSIAPKILFTKEAPSRAKLLVKPWDVLVSTVRPNRKNIALVPDVDLDFPIVASTGFSVLRFKSKAETVFYHCWLRSDAATQQLMRWNAGGSYPAIDDDIAISTLVPQYPDEIVEEQGKRWLIKFIGEDLSICLTTAAKLLVEALIEGKLTEDELKIAQEALQKGDREPDKAILSRLTRKGYDIKDEPPLFPDLDLIYQTIDQLYADEQGE